MLRKEFLREKAVDSGICFDKASQEKKGFHERELWDSMEGREYEASRLTRTRNHSHRPYGRATGWLDTLVKGKR